jgi:MOSC domain-containing protein
MSNALGSVVSLWRYPVKSMMGEELPVSEVTDRGLLGDRAYAVVDASDGKVASAKNPRKWPRMFEFRAAFAAPLSPVLALPEVRVTLADGSEVTSADPDHDKALSRAFGRAVTLEAADPARRDLAGPPIPQPRPATAEEYWPDMEGLDYRDTVTDFDLPEGTFFDCAVVHVLTTTTLDRLRALYPQGRFEVRRFRPNIVLDVPAESPGFVENGWIGRTIQLGEHVVLRVTEPCPGA